MSRPVGAVLVGLVLASALARPARAEATDHRSRFTFGVSFGGSIREFVREVADREKDHDDTVMGGPRLRYEHRLLERLWLGAELGLSALASGVEEQLGYTRTRVDLGLAPRAQLLQFQKGPGRMLEVYTVIPFGLSYPFKSAPERRAFQERFQGKLGRYAGVTLGLSWHHGRWIFGGELGYTLRSTGMRTTWTINGTTTSEDRRLVDHELGGMVGVGVAF